MKIQHLFVSVLMLITITLNSCSKKSDPKPDDPKENNVDLHDKSFTSIGGNGWTAALQPDGKVIVAGSFGTISNYNFKIHRFNKDGGIDNSFDIDVDKSWKINSFSSLAVLSDGKIMVGGDFSINGNRKILIKLTANGALDNSFVTPNFNTVGTLLPVIEKIIDLGSDRMLIAGDFNMFTASPRLDFYHLAKITYTGLLDISFQTKLSASASLSDLLKLNDGKLFISGSNLSWGNGGSPRRYIAKLNSNGSQDLSFHFKESLGGMFGFESGYINAIALQSDGKIVIGGQFVNIENTLVRDGVYDYDQLARLNTDGSIDFTFKTSKGFRFHVKDLEVLSDNRILVGRGFSLVAGTGREYLRLYSKDGDVDNSFNFGYDDSYVTQILKQQTGKYILVGEFTDPSTQAVLRMSLK